MAAEVASCGTGRYDTSLTDAGVQQAKAAAKQTRHLRPAPELIIASPLSRALHTADLCLPPATYPDAPRIAHPLARERLYLSSDVGLPKCVRPLYCQLANGFQKHMGSLQFPVTGAGLKDAALFSVLASPHANQVLVFSFSASPHVNRVSVFLSSTLAVSMA